MTHELNDFEDGPGLASENAVSLAEDREGCELIEGRWVEKDREEMPPEIGRKGFELIDGNWIEKSMSDTYGNRRFRL